MFFFVVLSPPAAGFIVLFSIFGAPFLVIGLSPVEINCSIISLNGRFAFRQFAAFDAGISLHISFADMAASAWTPGKEESQTLFAGLLARYNGGSHNRALQARFG